jgi:hypothetical protein
MPALSPTPKRGSLPIIALDTLCAPCAARASDDSEYATRLLPPTRRRLTPSQAVSSVGTLLPLSFKESANEMSVNPQGFPADRVSARPPRPPVAGRRPAPPSLRSSWQARWWPGRPGPASDAEGIITQAPDGPLHHNDERVTEAGTRPNPAKLTLARKIASTAPALWKKENPAAPSVAPHARQNAGRRRTWG